MATKVAINGFGRIGRAVARILLGKNGDLELVAIMQKFIDQTISANTNYDPARYPDGKVPVKQIIKDMLTAYKLGIKTLYYHNTRDGASDLQVDLQEDNCAGGACTI